MKKWAKTNEDLVILLATVVITITMLGSLHGYYKQPTHKSITAKKKGIPTYSGDE